MAAFRLFKLILFASMNFKLEPNAVKVEFVAFSVVESNCPNKSPVTVLSQASWQRQDFHSILLLNLIFH
jgi:hypothetical protein